MLYAYHISCVHQRLFLKEGGLQVLMKVLEKCSAAASFDAKQSAQKGFSLLSWCAPVFKSIRLTSECRASPLTPGIVERLARVACTAIWFLV